jgi:hypothetical protein
VSRKHKTFFLGFDRNPPVAVWATGVVMSAVALVLEIADGENSLFKRVIGSVDGEIPPGVVHMLEDLQ